MHQNMKPSRYQDTQHTYSTDFEDAVLKFIENNDSPEATVNKRITPTPPTTCLVCGDPTQCCHYHVPSCPACKAFFRRCIISGKTYFCKNKGKCDVKAKERCRRCRYDQCIFVGMNPIGIKLPDEIDLAVVIERIEARKRVLMPNLDGYVTNLPSTSTAKSSSVESMPVIPLKLTRIKMPQPMEFRDVDTLLFLEMKVRQLRESTYHPSAEVPYTLQSMVKNRTELSNADRYPSMKMNSLPVTHDDYVEDAKVLDNLKPPEPHRKNWIAIDVFLSIEMAKAMPVFEELTYSDKEAFILNATVTTAVFTSSYYSNEVQSEVIVYPDGFAPIWLAKLHHNELNTIESEVFIRCIEPIKRIGMTKEEYVLLKAIIFCNPACNNISDAGQRLLERESDRYSKTLLRYMQSIHGDAKGASRYAQVIAIMEAMTYFAKRHKELHVLIWMHVGKKKEDLPHFHQIVETVMQS